MGAQCYRSWVRPEQKIVANWMERIRAEKGWSWSQWAKEAEIKAATTLSRAVKDTFDSTSKIETLHSLARAAKVPSVLDFLEGEAVSVGALKTVLSELLPMAGKSRWTEKDVELLVEALAYGLGLPEAGSTTQASEGAYAVAARAAAARFRDLNSEP